MSSSDTRSFIEKLRAVVCILNSEIESLNSKLSAECPDNDAFDNGRIIPETIKIVGSVSWFDNDAYDDGPVKPQTYIMVGHEEDYQDEIVVWKPL